MSEQVNYGEFTEGFDEAKVNHGAPALEAYASGWYPFTIVAAEMGIIPTTKVPLVKLQLAVSDEGEQLKMGKRRCFVDFFVGAGRTAYSYEHGQRQELQLSDAKFKEAKDAVRDKVATFMTAVGVRVNKNVTASPGDPDYMAQFLNIKDWPTRKFMGRVSKRADKTGEYGDKNRLEQYYATDDAQFGLAWWLENKKGQAATIKAIEKAQVQGGGKVNGGGAVQTVAL